LEPGKEAGAYGGVTIAHRKSNIPVQSIRTTAGINDNYKVGAATHNIPYVEKHHGNDLGVNPKRPFVKYQIPGGVIPAHLKINKPISTLCCPTGYPERKRRPPVLEDPDFTAILSPNSIIITVNQTGGTSFRWYDGSLQIPLSDMTGALGGINEVGISGAETETLSFTVTDWGVATYFLMYCVVTNDDGSVTTGLARLDKP
jgi:hypothetical protein